MNSSSFKFLFLLVYFIINVVFVSEPSSVIYTIPMLATCLLFSLTLDHKYFKTDDMILLAAYLFFVVRPLQGLDNGFFSDGPTAGLQFSSHEIWTATASATIFFSIVFVIRYLGNAKKKEKVRLELKALSILPLFLLNAVSFAGTVIGSGGFANLAATRYDKDVATQSVVAFPSVALQIVTTFLIFSTLFEKRQASAYPLRLTLSGISLIFLFISINPYNSARYFLIAAWFPILFVYFHGKIKALNMYAFVFIFIIVAMPILNLTSREGRSAKEAISEVFSDTYTAADFIKIPFMDVFDMSVFQMRFMNDKPFSYGEKTLGLALFFVPRSVWTDKSSLTALDIGGILAESKVAGTSNLSFFVGGDFYADAGLLGVFLGAVFIGLLLNFMRWRGRLVNGVDLHEGVMTAAMPILIRGPLGANLGLTFLELGFLAVILTALTSDVPLQKSVDTAAGG